MFVIKIPAGTSQNALIFIYNKKILLKMAEGALEEWIKQQRAGGAAEEQIKAALVQQGYDEKEVNEALTGKKPNTAIILMAVIIVALIAGAVIFSFYSSSKISETKKEFQQESQKPENATKELQGAEVSRLKNTGNFEISAKEVAMPANSKKIIYAGIRNTGSSDAVVRISSKCVNKETRENIIQPKEIAVRPNEVQVIEIEVSSAGLAADMYVCNVLASSSLGETHSYESALLVNVG